MIIVIVNYDPGWFDPGHGDGMHELRDLTEAVVGQVCAEEQNHVDVVLRPYGEYDQRETVLFLEVDVSEDQMHTDPAKIANQLYVAFTEHYKDYFHSPSLRVWVRRVLGSFVEPE